MDLHVLATGILNHAAQLTVLAALVWCAAKLFAENRPHLAHALWILVLIKCVVPPAWSSPTSLFNVNALNLVSTSTDRSLNQSHTVPDNSSVTNDANRVNELMASSSNFHLSVNLGEKNDFPIIAEPFETQWYSESKVTPSRQPFTKVPHSALAFGIIAIAIGFAVGLLLTCARLLYFLKAAYSKGYYQDPEIDDFVQQLSKRLGVKRFVSVRLVRNPIGPVVLGLIRPTLLLPELIVRGRKLAELEPLIAHELIHIRRGDLWWSMLQAVATSLWWFHPLVRLAGRMVCRETERSCDEETVACLGCSPAAYARSLLDVLERKHQLQIAPAVPGVRPIEVTLDRMERIMKLGQGSHKRTPGWIWAALFIACAVALPNGSVGVAQDAGKQDSDEPVQAIGPARKVDGGVFSHWQSYRENVGDLIDALKDQGMSEKDAASWVLSHLPFRNQEDADVENPLFKRVIVDGQVESDLGLIGKIEITVPTPQITDRELRVFDTKKKIDEIKTKLQFLRETCKKQISCEVKVIQFKKDDFKEVSANWSLSRKNPDGVRTVIDSKELAVGGPSLDTRMRVAMEAVRSHMGLAFEFARPVSYLLNEEEFDAILKRKDIRCEAAPRVTGRSGQTVSISFQLDSKTGDEENFLQGTSLELTPTIMEGQRISLRTKYRSPSINKQHPWNDTGGHGKRVLDALRKQNPKARISEDATLQLALVQAEQGKMEEAAETFNELLDTYPESQLQFLTTEVPIGKTHVICLPTKVDGEAGVLVVLVKCTVVDPPKGGDSATFEKPTDVSGFVNVGGAVKKPERYELDEPTNVAQAIAAAGGIHVPGSEPGSVYEVIILRQFNGTYILTNFTLDRAQLGSEATQADELWLKKDDIVFVKPASPIITSAQAKELSRTNQKSVFEHVPVIGQTTAGLLHDIPRLENHEVMDVLNQQRKTNGKYALDSEQYSRIEIEKLAESKDDKRFIPLIGDAVLYHTFYQCTVYLKDSDERHVVFIDHNHFHMD